jgi:hypothetical protein
VLTTACPETNQTSGHAFIFTITPVLDDPDRHRENSKT